MVGEKNGEANQTSGERVRAKGRKRQRKRELAE
jgi:hypothetical protein